MHGLSQARLRITSLRPAVASERDIGASPAGHGPDPDDVSGTRPVSQVPFVIGRASLYGRKMLHRPKWMLALVLGIASAQGADVLQLKENAAIAGKILAE